MTQPNSRALTMLATAIEMEMKGLRFYGTAAAQCKSAPAAETFRKLEKMEIEHISHIAKIYGAIHSGSAVAATDLHAAGEEVKLVDFFRELARRQGTKVETLATEIEVLDAGIDFEAKAVAFYEHALGQATDEIERRFLEGMIQEEKDHVATLSELKLYLTDPKAWTRLAIAGAAMV